MVEQVCHQCKTLKKANLAHINGNISGMLTFISHVNSLEEILSV